jgi:hypothetical protein
MQPFRLNTNYISASAFPVHGTSSVDLRSTTSLVSLGYGNLLSKGRIAYSVEAGVAFHGTPTALLTLAGSACTTVNGGGGTSLLCQNVATTPSIQSNVAALDFQVLPDLPVFDRIQVLIQN